MPLSDTAPGSSECSEWGAEPSCLSLIQHQVAQGVVSGGRTLMPLSDTAPGSSGCSEWGAEPSCLSLIQHQVAQGVVSGGQYPHASL